MRLIDLDEFLLQNCIDRMDGKTCEECKYHVLEVSCERLMEHPPIDPVVRCKDCKHFHLNVFGDEIGIGKPYDRLIVGHEMCDAWGDGCKTAPEGFCFLGEKR